MISLRTTELDFGPDQRFTSWAFGIVQHTHVGEIEIVTVLLLPVYRRVGKARSYFGIFNSLRGE